MNNKSNKKNGKEDTKSETTKDDNLIEVTGN